jgi:mono/diheme cytochrome c family protein
MAARGRDGRLGIRPVAWAGVPAALTLALALLVTVGAMGYDTEESGEVGASEGVFSEEQRDAGQELFAANCARCHGAELGGGMGPPLNDLPSTWGGSTLGSLYRFVSSNMPMDAPGSLSDEEYAAVIAFVLSQNGFPHGEEPLPADGEALNHFVLDEPPVD